MGILHFKNAVVMISEITLINHVQNCCFMFIRSKLEKEKADSTTLLVVTDYYLYTDCLALTRCSVRICRKNVE